MLQHSSDYLDWLNSIKQRVVAARMRVALAANSELIRFYWELGSQIDEKQQYSQWGDKIIQQLSADLQKEFPEIKGFSTTNLKYCLRFYQFFAELQPSPFGQQPVDQIPWGHNIQIFTKCTSLEEASFYISQTLEQGWSRDVLALQLKSRLHERAGKTISNFSRTLPAPQSDLAQQTLKDPTLLILCSSLPPSTSGMSSSSLPGI